MSGTRLEGYQALRCPTCGEGVFVLPRSPLPEPADAPQKSPKRTSSRSTFADVDEGPIALTDADPSIEAGRAPIDEIEWVDEEEQAGPVDPARAYQPSDPTDLAAAEIALERAKAAPPMPPRPARKAGGPEPDAPPGDERPKRAKRAPRTPDEPPPERAVPRRSVLEWARAHRSPLIFASVGLVVASTLWFRSYRAWRQDLPRVAELGRVEGLEALDAGKFDTARQVLAPARRAVEALGSDYDPAAGAAIRRGADEIEIIAGLASASLEQMLEEASRTDPKEWESRFDTLYKGKAVIIEDQLQSVPDGAGHGRHDLYYRVFRPGEGPRPGSVARVDLDGFGLLQDGTAKVGDNMIFGARLASFRYDLAGEEWVVGLEPSSGVVMTHRKALEALRWPGPIDGLDDGAGGRP